MSLKIQEQLLDEANDENFKSEFSVSTKLTSFWVKVMVELREIGTLKLNLYRHFTHLIYVKLDFQRFLQLKQNSEIGWMLAIHLEYLSLPLLPHGMLLVEDKQAQCAH